MENASKTVCVVTKAIELPEKIDFYFVTLSNSNKSNCFYNGKFFMVSNEDAKIGLEVISWLNTTTVKDVPTEKDFVDFCCTSEFKKSDDPEETIFNWTVSKFLPRLAMLQQENNELKKEKEDI